MTYDQFVHAGANLSEADKTQLKKLNEEISTLSNAFMNKLLAATKDAVYATTDKIALAGLTDAQLAAAAQLAKPNATSKAMPCRCRTPPSSPCLLP